MALASARLHSPRVPTERISLCAGLVAVGLALESSQASPSKVTDPVTRQDRQLVESLDFEVSSGMEKLFNHLKTDKSNHELK